MHRIFRPCIAGIALCTIAMSAAASSLVHLPYKGPGQVRELRARGIEIVAFTRNGIDVAADDKQVSWLFTRPYPVSVVATPEMARSQATLNADLGLYHTYAETGSLLTAIATAHPAIAQLSIIGTSVEGRNIYALKISDNVTVDEPEAEVALMGNLHARELMAVEMPLLMAQYLTDNYGSDATVTDYVDNREIWILPMLNPDGHAYVENNHSGSWWTWWRLNRRVNSDLSVGVDLNRNFGYEWGYDNIGSSPVPGSETYRGPAAFSEPETAALRDFVDSHHFTLWLSYHSYGELLLYPWGYLYGYTPDHAVYEELGNRLTAANGYLPGNPAMGAIYVANGDSDDWGYGDQVAKGKVFAFTPEVNNSSEGGFGPPDSLIAPTFARNLNMNLLAIDLADNPYRVVGPYAPQLFAVTNPFGNDIHRLSWSAPDPGDPNPPVTYDIEVCTNPTWKIDDASLASAWTLGGFSVSPSGKTGNGYFSGSGNNLNHFMMTKAPLLVTALHDTIRFDANYDIELDWDYAYVEVSTDQGLTWSPIEGNLSTTTNPNGNNRGFGITGTSGGWVAGVYPLDAYAGQEILLRMSYITDGAVTNPGFWVDDIDAITVCGSLQTLATGVTGTDYDVIPTVVGTNRYRVHAVDADGDVSRWSNSTDYTVSTVTATGVGRTYRTAIGANAPNPFNPVTTIPYIVGGRPGAPPEAITLRIYSVRGALVTTLVDAHRAPGTYRAAWDGTDTKGRSMASGVYFARLEVNGLSPSIRKLVLLK